MASLDIASATPVLKEYYSGQRVTEMMYKNMPLWALLRKVKDFGGKTYPLPFSFAGPQGRSGTFANAQAQKTATKYESFELTRAKDYSLASIDSEAVYASESDAGAFLRLATAEIDNAFKSLKRSIAFTLYGDGGGTLGQSSGALTSGSTITLVNVEDISKIEVGQTLQARSAATAGTLRTYDGTNSSVTVATVNRNTGTFTISQTFTGSSTWANNDYIVVVGDYDAKFKGLAAWIPSSTPSATSFFGVDRTVDSSRLGGIRVTSTGLPLDEAFIEAARRTSRDEAAPDFGFMGFSRYASLEKTMGSRVVYQDVEVGNIGFRGIKISGPQGPITLLADKDCPENKAYLLTMENWAFYSLGEPGRLLDYDGNKLLRESGADAYEVRVGMYGQLGCAFPGSNCVMSF